MTHTSTSAKDPNVSGEGSVDSTGLFEVEITTPLPELPPNDVQDALSAGLNTLHAEAELSIDADAQSLSVSQTIRSRERAKALDAAESTFFAAVFAGGDKLEEWEKRIDHEMSVRVSSTEERGDNSSTSKIA